MAMGMSNVVYKVLKNGYGILNMIVISNLSLGFILRATMSRPHHKIYMGLALMGYCYDHTMYVYLHILPGFGK